MTTTTPRRSRRRWIVNVLLIGAACTPRSDPSDDVRVGPTAPIPAVPLTAFELTMDCATHGEAIRRSMTQVRSAPPLLRFAVDDEQPTEVGLRPEQLAPLAHLLATPEFADFLGDIPTPVGPHAGMTECRLVLVAPDNNAEISWTRGDTFSPTAAAAVVALHAELVALRRGP